MYWETIEGNGLTSYRAKVPGGWMVFVRRIGEEAGAFFYPDPQHLWNGKTL